MASIINAATSGGLISTGDTSGQLQLQTAGTTALTVTSGQLVGIGTSSPSSILDVSSAATVLRLTSTTGTNSVYHRFSNTGGQLYFGIDNSAGNDLAAGSTAYAGVLVAPGTTRNLHLGTNGTVQATITSAGNLGIGTTSPSSKLTVTGGQARILSSTAFAANPLDNGSWSGAITVNTNDGSGDLSGIGMYVNSSYGAGCGIFAKQTSSTTADLTFFTGSGVGASNVERARITSSGNLLVGTTSNPGGAGTINITGTYTTSGVTPMTASGVGANPGTAAIFDGSGNLYKLSSSLRYKENITDWTVTDEQLNAFINVNPKLWDYIGKENGCAGFIAEDIEALGLKNAYNTSPLINYSNEGLPDSNRDFALIALQHKVLQKLQQSIQELSAQVTELKAEVQALKGA